jgi:hypothetical protein
MDPLGRVIGVCKKASPDFKYFPVAKKSCMTHILYSSRLNQIIAIKFPNREHYIPKNIAFSYLQSTRKTILAELGKSVCRDAYVLNILISNRLTKSRFDLITTDDKKKNMDMLFNPKKTKDKEILKAIFQALATKGRRWLKRIKERCEDKKIIPFSEVRRKIKDIERAIDIFHLESVRLRNSSEKYKKEVEVKK